MGTNFEVARDWLSMAIYGSKYIGISLKQQLIVRNRLEQASRELGVKAK